MILIADSGSTKTSWCLTNNNGLIQYFSSNGINPFFRTSEDIEAELRAKLLPEVVADIEEIFFYGAGIINEEKGNIVKNALQRLFPTAEIEVQSDLLAAARSTLGNKKGIACILGTGSNSCLYDGKKIVENIPPLGFILGDEGSGAVLGQKLLADYLKGIMPEKISNQFHDRFQYSYAELLERVYKKENPNQFLAQFVSFLAENIFEEYCSNLLTTSFEEFVERNISRYSGYKKYPICFVGSIAFHFQEQLKSVMKQNKLQINTVLKDPIEGLLEYHSEK